MSSNQEYKPSTFQTKALFACVILLEVGLAFLNHKNSEFSRFVAESLTTDPLLQNYVNGGIDALTLLTPLLTISSYTHQYQRPMTPEERKTFIDNF